MRSTSVLREWLLRRPASLPHVILVERTATTPAMPTTAMPRRSRPEATTSCSTWATFDAFWSSLSAASIFLMSSSGSRRWLMASRIRESRFCPPSSSGCERRSSTTATVHRARPDEIPRPTSRFWTARKTRSPRPEAPMMAAMPTMAMASMRVWLRPAMIEGLASGNWTSVRTRNSVAP